MMEGAHLTTRRCRYVHCLSLVVLAWWLASCESHDWPTYRHDTSRNADQHHDGAVSDPARVPTLHTVWDFHPALAGDPDAQFSASATVYDDRVLVGNLNGRFYALKAATGAFLWKFPPDGQPRLLSQFLGNPSGPGIASSGAIARFWAPWFWFLKRRVTAVIFGAPDPTTCLGAPPVCGSGRLWALDIHTGALIWKSDVIARLDGLTFDTNPPPGFAEHHERIGYSSPVVHRHRVYVGVADDGDSPIQSGKLVAVDLRTGHIVPSFNFQSSGPPRGGGIWSSPVFHEHRLFVTTGNGCTPSDGNCSSEPPNNHALSMLSLNPANGAIIWSEQPVPWSLDADPDWAGTPVVTETTCGTLAVGTMKDGWTHAFDAHTGAVRWSFPFVVGGLPFSYANHGDNGYTRPVAAWRDTIITVTGGLPVTSNIADGYDRLYSLEACASYNSADKGRIRWIADVPGLDYTGQPTITDGIVYIGNNQGKLFAIADPEVSPAAGQRCSMPGVANAACVASGFELVANPAILATVPLSGGIRTEPVLAEGRVYVGTDGGHLYALEP